MAAQDFDATDAPRDIVAVLGLSNGTSYTAMNLGPTGTLFMREQTGAPTTSDRAFKIEVGSPFTIQPTGDPIWFWSDPGGVAVIVEDAVT